jgi:hypothetical protein
LASGAVRFTYDKYLLLDHDFPATGLGYKSGRFSCTAATNALRPV